MNKSCFKFFIFDFKFSARLRNDGQFLPISLMVMFSMIAMMVTAVNIYKISRAKLQAQNLADAIALAVATQEARMLNVVVDRNEWLNHFYDTSAAGNANQAGTSVDTAVTNTYNLTKQDAQCLANCFQAISTYCQTYAPIGMKTNIPAHWSNPCDNTTPASDDQVSVTGTSLSQGCYGSGPVWNAYGPVPPIASHMISTAHSCNIASGSTYSSTSVQAPSANNAQPLPMLYPPISFAENSATPASGNGGYVFNSFKGAAEYADMVATINDAQKLFQDSYNEQIGAPGAGAPNSRALDAILRDQIPALNDPAIAVRVWNHGDDPMSQTPPMPQPNGTPIDAQTQAIPFATHDIQICYLKDIQGIFGNQCCVVVGPTPLSAIEQNSATPAPLATDAGGKIGWRYIDWTNTNVPKIPIEGGRNHAIGAGVSLTKQVDLGFLGSHYKINVKSMAYVVPGSGVMPGDDRFNHTITGSPNQVESYYSNPTNQNPPMFVPTYWAKLGKP